jgi:pimeloyl-ACP methyl ester carboxylesterase
MNFSMKIVKNNVMKNNNKITYTKDSLMIDTINVYYESYVEEGREKPTIILIHGFLSSIFSFRKLMPLLTDHYHVYAIDLPPFGKSEKSKSFFYSFSTYSNLVASFCEKQGISKVNIVGHSLGGQIALHVAIRYPELVEKLILLCSSGYINRPSRKMLAASYIPFFKWYMKRKIAETGIRGNLMNVVYDKKIVNEELELGYVEPFLDEAIFDALLVMYRKLEDHLISNELGQISTEALLIWGKEDRVTPLSVGKKLHEDLPNSNLIVYEKAGHLIPEEIPEKITRDIKNYLCKTKLPY